MIARERWTCDVGEVSRRDGVLLGHGLRREDREGEAGEGGERERREKGGRERERRNKAEREAQGVRGQGRTFII